MSSAWREITRPNRADVSESGKAFGLTSDEMLPEPVQRLADTMVGNDFKAEYYYSQNDIVLDAFKNHLAVADLDPKLYAEIVKMLMPVSLECQRILAACILWDRDINKQLVQELLNSVRPTWKMTFFYMFKKQPYPGILRKKGWGRALRKWAGQFVLSTPPYHAIKYRSKLQPIARWAHINSSEPMAKWLFQSRKPEGRRDLTDKEGFFKDYFGTVEKLRSGELKVTDLDSVNLPFTVLNGLLGQEKVNDPEVFRRLLHTMTTWELILNLKQMQNRGLFESQAAKNYLMTRLGSAKLQEMRIDVVELMQAYRQIEHQFAKDMLTNMMHVQIAQIARRLQPFVDGKKVAVVFDTSGSMYQVAEWSYSLALALTLAAKQSVTIAFANETVTLPVPEEESLIFETFRSLLPRGGTAAGSGLAEALQHSPDIIFFISDMEQNVEPYTWDVAREKFDPTKKFPEVVAIKFTTSPQTSIGEWVAIHEGRWLGTPNEHKLVIRNIWDLPTVLEYLFNLLPLLKKRVKESIPYVA